MLTATRDQARATPSAPWRIVRIGPGITPESLLAFVPVQAAVLGVRAFEPKWRARQDETENSYVIVCAI